jgi:hypothetical protein
MRCEPGIFDTVASDPTVSSLVADLARNAPAVLTGIAAACADVCRAAWGHAGDAAPDHDISIADPLVIDLVRGTVSGAGSPPAVVAQALGVSGIELGEALPQFVSRPVGREQFRW